MSEFWAKSKSAHAAAKRNRREAGSAGKYAYHAHFHGDWLRGVANLAPDERGVYQTIIDLQYERRGPLPDDDEWLARQNNCPLRTYRRIKQKLIEKGRLIVDAEAGTLYDERAMRELASAGVMKETQAKRGRDGAAKRWTKAPQKALEATSKAIPEAATEEEVSAEKLQLFDQQVDKCGPISLQLIETKPLKSHNTGAKSAMHFGMATHYPLSIDTLTDSANLAPSAPGAPPATLTGGGAPQRQRNHRPRAGPGGREILFSEATRAATLAAYRAALEEDAAP